MADKGYLIGESVRLKLRQVFDRVDGIPVPSNIYRVPTDLSTHDIAPAGGSAVKLAAFTGTSVWVRMQPRQIYFYETNTNDTVSLLPVVLSEKTATAIATMFSIPGVTTTTVMATAMVTVTKMHDRWHVIAAAGGA